MQAAKLQAVACAVSMDPYPDVVADRVGAVERVEAGEAYGLGGLPSGR